ncbi:DUF4167 domain-containing protein [Sphingomonas sp. CA1-15]|uniref:DUF4167 domain-containing protein n=1 Tax=Sphingomonas immobilis TaxID=3063997 RepID=A0ABT9A280_9SPHN|nr:DUF4167 domain-containing protein [Sphingomonas sp. CA1-15]MDO7843931.1 DUF4167 domain-containing protein [Sphingomonas sp. CA1-15]
MINNRQAGRRRGRGGQQQRSQGGNPGRGQDNGNRIDNRARGNAAQLLEKYKTLARDAQMQGDRVNTEYYLQFADHYFRVLAETRSRFEENRPQPRGANTFEDDEQEFDDDGEPVARADQQPRQQGNGQNGGQQDGQQRNGQNGNGNYANGNGGGNGQYDDERPRNRQDGNRQDGNGGGNENGRNRDRGDRNDRYAEDRGNRGNRQDRYEQEDRAPEGREEAPAPAPVVEAAAEAPAEPRRRGRPRRSEQPVETNDAPTFDAGLLPPSLTLSATQSDAGEGDEVKPKPRRRRAAPETTPA